LAPERLLVIEIRGSVRDFARTIQRVAGLALIDEDELAGDESDKAPAVYLMVPDQRALTELLSLWKRWQAGRLISGETQWGEVFGLLRVLRTWGPQDRIDGGEFDVLTEEISGYAPDAIISLEIELIYRRDKMLAEASETEVEKAVVARAGKIVARARIDAIAYHALLVALPVSEVQEILALSGITGLDEIMHIGPQSMATSIEVADTERTQASGLITPALGQPLLALLDGVPMASHPLLQQHLIVDDQFELEPYALVAERRHGTAMASLIVHGDRNTQGPILPRRVHLVPVFGAKDEFPNDRLIVDLTYQAVIGMLEGDLATAPSVLLVNLSLGNCRRPFHRHLSAWARLIDRLAYQYGILFLVSAGNIKSALPLSSFSKYTSFEDSIPQDRATQVLLAIDAKKVERRMFSPAETVNGLTIGAANIDNVTVGRRHTDPYVYLSMSNPSSALGPGFANSAKPDVLMPGSREHLSFKKNDPHVFAEPANASFYAGLKVAAPSATGEENFEGLTGGTSAACALASRTCHRIHDALEATYGAGFMQLPKHQRAALIKALFVHTATWPEATAEFIRQTVGPAGGRNHVRQKDNIRRFLGFGVVSAEAAIACAADRATFWACGELDRDKIVTIEIPVPLAFGAKAQPHSLSATIAWMTPTSPGRRNYRSVRLKINEPSEIGALGIKGHGSQPDVHQANRGTVFTRRWTGSKAAAVSDSTSIQLGVQRDPDQAVVIDQPIPFGVAVTLAMPGVVEIYDQVKQRLALMTRVSA